MNFFCIFCELILKHCWCQSNVWCDTFASFFFPLLRLRSFVMWCETLTSESKLWNAFEKRGGAMKNNKSNNQHISLCFTTLKLRSLDIFFLFRSRVSSRKKLVINFDVTWWIFLFFWLHNIFTFFKYFP